MAANGHILGQEQPWRLVGGIGSYLSTIYQGVLLCRLTEHASHILPYLGMGSGILRALDEWPRIDLLDDVRGNQFSAVVWRPAAEWAGATPRSPRQSPIKLPIKLPGKSWLSPSRLFEGVHLIDWQRAERNDFAIVEEFTPRGGHQRHIGLALYINGIGMVVIELRTQQ